MSRWPESEMPIESALAEALAEAVGREAVSWEEADLAAYSRDAWGLHRAGGRHRGRLCPPELLVRPRSTEQVAAVVRLAAREGVPIVPYGGGSGVAGGACSVAPGIALDMAAMNRILAIDGRGFAARVEAGAILADLEGALNRQGLILGHDPWSLPVATVGGAISTDGLGYRSSRYGSMGDQVLGLVVVLPDGSVLSTRAVPKSSTGFDLKRLFIGAEGVLGVITEATLRVFPAPEERVLRAYRFPSFEAGFAAIQGMFAIGLAPALLDYGENPLPWPLRPLGWALHLQAEAPTLYLGFEGFREEVAAQDGRSRAVCRAQGGRELGREVAQEFWAARHRAGETYARYRSWGRRRYWLRRLLAGVELEYVDVALPASQVLAYRERCREMLARRGVRVVEWGLWNRPELLNVVMLKLSLFRRGAGEVPTSVGTGGLGTRDSLPEAADEARRLAQSMGGSMESCHGVGLRLAHLMGEEHGRGLALMRQLKAALDPKNIMNPGKMGL